jgi:hypothetical protein
MQTNKAASMRKLLLSLVVFGTVAAVPVCAAPVIRPAQSAVAALDLNTTLNQSTVQTVQYGYRGREYRRRQEIRRREEYRRRQALRRAYRRPY